MPVGIADYGVLNASGVLKPYKIFYDEAIGVATIYSLYAYNPYSPFSISQFGASLQQNVVLQVNTTSGNYEYWLQNAVLFITNVDKMNFLDNVWNLSSLHSSLTNETINGGGKVSQLGSDYYYYFMKSPFQYSLPLSIYLYITFSYSYNAVYVNFGYSLGSSTPITWYDTVTIHESGVNNASLVISGYSLNPGGGFYDSELVFGRERNSEVTDFTSMNATLSMKYKLPNGSLSLPPALYGFGSDTAKAADDLSTVLINGTPTVEIGNGNFSPIYYSVEILTFSA